MLAKLVTVLPGSLVEASLCVKQRTFSVIGHAGSVQALADERNMREERKYYVVWTGCQARKPYRIGTIPSMCLPRSSRNLFRIACS